MIHWMSLLPPDQLPSNGNKLYEPTAAASSSTAATASAQHFPSSIHHPIGAAATSAASVSAPPSAAVLAASAAGSFAPESEQRAILSGMNVRDLPKKPPAAYHLFAADVRAEYAKLHPNEPTASANKHANEIAHNRWHGTTSAASAAAAGVASEPLTAEQKRAYDESYNRQLSSYEQQLIARRLEPKIVELFIASKNSGAAAPAAAATAAAAASKSKSASGGGSGAGDEVTLALGRVKRIMQLDDDVNHISKEATALVTKATELFISWYANSCGKLAQKQGKKTIRPVDFYEVMKRSDDLEFLRGCIPRADNDAAPPTKASVKRKSTDSAAASASAASAVPVGASAAAAADGGDKKPKYVHPALAGVTAPPPVAAAPVPEKPVASAPAGMTMASFFARATNSAAAAPASNSSSSSAAAAAAAPAADAASK